MERARKKRLHHWALTLSVGVSAAASTILLCFGIVRRWELLFVIEFIFFEGITLSAIAQAIRIRSSKLISACRSAPDPVQRTSGLGSLPLDSSYVILPLAVVTILLLTPFEEIAASRRIRVLSICLALSTSLTTR